MYQSRVYSAKELLNSSGNRKFGKLVHKRCDFNLTGNFMDLCCKQKKREDDEGKKEDELQVIPVFMLVTIGF